MRSLALMLALLASPLALAQDPDLPEAEAEPETETAEEDVSLESEGDIQFEAEKEAAKQAASPGPETSRSVTLPTGKTIEAEVIEAPSPGTVEFAILESMKMISNGDHDTWIQKYCSTEMCPDANAITSVKRLNLSASQKTVGRCYDKDKLVLTRRRGDIARDGRVTIYAWCGENRMPAPATLIQEGGEWKVSSLSW